MGFICLGHCRIALVSLLNPLLSAGLLPADSEGELGREEGGTWGGVPLLLVPVWILFFLLCNLNPVIVHIGLL